MRFLVGVSAAFAAGGLIGAGLGIILTEDKFRKEYQESAASMRRAMELAREVHEDVEEPAETEEDLVAVTGEVAELVEIKGEEVNDSGPKNLFDDAGGLAGLNDFGPQDTNPYHQAVEYGDGPSFTIIEEEDYQDEDGNHKGQITITMDDQIPVFFENGTEIRDWADKIGDTILRDFYTKCPPGKEQVLFVRNNQTDTDYEVIYEQP